MTVPKLKWTETDVINAIRTHYVPLDAVQHGQEEWSLLTQVSSVRAYETLPSASQTKRLPAEEREHYAVLRKDRRIDVLLLRNWAGRIGHELIAIEVKVSRADFFHDTEEKRRPWWLLSNRFAYAVPAGLVTPDEVPAGCGLIEILGGPCRNSEPHVHTSACVGVLRWNRAVKAEKRVVEVMPLGLAVEFARRASRMDTRIAAALPQLTEPNPDSHADVDGVPVAAVPGSADGYAALLKQVKDLTARQTNLQHQLDTLRAQRRATIRAVAPLLTQTCHDCGQPITAKYYRGQRTYRWEHAPERGTGMTRVDMDRVCPSRTYERIPAVLSELDVARGDDAVTVVLDAMVNRVTGTPA